MRPARCPIASASGTVVYLWLLTSFKQVYAAQMTKVNHAVTSVQTAQFKNAKSINNLNQEYDGMAGIISAVSRYNMTCSNYLTGIVPLA